MNPGLSVFVLAKNAEKNLGECLQTARTVADEMVVVVDADSSDGTADAARTFTPHVFVRPFDGFSRMKSFGMERCGREWALNLDTDERLPPDLISEIDAVKRRGSNPVSGYAVNRLPFFLGKPIRHGGWYPDWVIRLVRPSEAHYPLRAVHERIEVKGETCRLQGELLHYTAEDFRSFLEKQRRFAALSDAPRSLRACLTHPPAAFLKSAFLRMGVLDGWRGLAVAFAQGYYAYHKYRK